MKNRKLAPTHPGKILLNEFMLPMGISQNKLGRDLNVPPGRINEIIHGKRAISADTALRLGRYFGMSPRFWMNLQAHYDLETVEDALQDKITREVKVRPLNESQAAG